MKKNYYRIPIAIFIFIMGTMAAMALSQMLHDSITYGTITVSLANIPAVLGSIFSNENQLKLFLLLECFVLMLSILYYVLANRTYQADTYKVTDEISVPVPYGQGQHGTAWFMSEKEKKRYFQSIEISPDNQLIAKLTTLGKQRYAAIEKGEQYTVNETIDEILCENGGIVIEKSKSALTERLACITDDVHTLTIGATRCGKSRCLVLQSICVLALTGEGIVVNDPKGELYHYTHNMLETLGYTVRVIDFNAPKKSDRYNPLQMIINAVNEGRIDDAQTYTWDFVTFLVEKNDHSEPIWTNGEMAVIAAAVMCVVYDNKEHPEYQNLTNVYGFIANMCKTVNKVMPIDEYMRKLPDSHPAKSLMAIAKIAPDRMGGSFYTSALTTLRLFVTNDMYSMTRESEFSLDDVGKKPKQALFFILPDQKATYYPIVTLLVSQQYEQLVTYAKTRGNRLPYRVNFILDEFGNFAAINDFQIKMTVAGGYGIRWNLFLQDFNQLIDKYGQDVAKIIEGNCHYWIYLHSQDNDTNEQISKSLGKYTTSSYSLGGTTQKYAAPSSTTNIQLCERNLLNSDEIMKIKRPYQLVMSAYPPAVMRSPDISEWRFNTMLGLGSKQHNAKLIELDENSRRERGGMATQQKLWKPWEKILRAVPESEQPVYPEQPSLYKQTGFRRGGIL
ncbi:MAG: VirD4-like conjugal transfer protein, CD1115 family [Oscillospiraceae bacterium]